MSVVVIVVVVIVVMAVVPIVVVEVPRPQRRHPDAEGPNGWIKEVLGFRRFSLRGVEKVRGEWHLVCLALNVKRMAGLATC